MPWGVRSRLKEYLLTATLRPMCCHHIAMGEGYEAAASAAAASTPKNF
jgi:hypothetical protein